MRTEPTHSRGNAIIIVGGGGALVLAAVCIALGGTNQQGIATGLRATAVLGLPFLVGTYVAPALIVLWPGELSDWLLAHRRSLGLAFSAVFAVHLALIARFLSLPPNPPATALGLTLGFVAYMLLAAMMLASFSRVAMTLGAARVHLLRRIGEQWVFAVFTLTLVNGASKHSALWLLPLAIVLVAYAVRLTAWRSAPPLRSSGLDPGTDRANPESVSL
jgi:DMSO/TMAO reductase YedYZ heme-binding membrane subunit